MAIERRFLNLLSQVNRFWLHAGQLALDNGEGADFGVMFLTREDGPSSIAAKWRVRRDPSPPIVCPRGAA